MKPPRLYLALFTIFLCLTIPMPLFAQAQSAQQRVAMIKQWLQASQTQLRAYEWVETTVVSKNNEEKSRTQKRCFYGADGKVQKVVLAQHPAPESGPPGILPPGRILNKIKEKKKEDMTAYMQSAVDLVHSYIPPNPGLIQQSVNAGKMNIQVIQPERQIRLNFGNYLKQGDSLGIEVELPTNRLLALAVNSYLDSPQDAIAMNVTMAVLPDGTIYTERSTLDAGAKQLRVVVENSGYRRIQP